MLMLTTPNLSELRKTYEAAEVDFQATIARLFPGCDEWHWYRAIEHVKGSGICRRNDDTSNDEVLANSEEIAKAHERFVMALHAFYLLRDGSRGVLGGRGL